MFGDKIAAGLAQGRARGALSRNAFFAPLYDKTIAGRIRNSAAVGSDKEAGSPKSPVTFLSLTLSIGNRRESPD